MNGSRRVAVLPAVPRLADRAQAVRRERRQRRLRRAGLGVLALVPFGLVGWLLLSSPLLALHRVQVVGVSRLSVAQVLQAADVQLGTPLTRVDTGAVRDRVAGLAGVERVRVTRRWPTTLRVTVAERRALAAVRSPGRGWELVDAGGKAFATAARPPDGLPRLDTPDRASDRASGPATAAALAVLRDLPPPLRERVSLVRAPTPATVTLALRGGRTVVWGTPGQTAQKAAVVEALLPRERGTLDVTSPHVAVVRR